MAYLHSFVRTKSTQTIKDEGIIPCNLRRDFLSGEPLIVPENTGGGMFQMYGDGNLYFVSGSSSTYRFVHATTGEIVSSRQLCLKAVELNANGNPCAFRSSNVEEYYWLPQTLEIVSDVHWEPKYAVGDSVYANAEELVDYIGNSASLFYHRPCKITFYDINTDSVTLTESSRGVTCNCHTSNIMGKVEDIGPLPISDVAFGRCRRCNNRFIASSRRSEEDMELCPECAKRYYVTSYHRTQPQLTFWKTEDEAPTELYYGFELEIDVGGENNRTAEEIVRRMNPDPDNENGHPWFMYVSHDGSLRDGMELISCPATLKYHQSMRSKYAELFKWLSNRGYRSHGTSTCGLHFHFSRDYFRESGDEDGCTTRLLYLVEKFWDELTVFSRRDYQSLAHYAKKLDQSPEDFFDSWNRNDDHDGHYYSVNITNQNTIEFRMFRGTLNINTFMVTLELVDQFVHAAREKTLRELQQLTFEDLVPEDAKEYYYTRLEMSKFED